MKRSDIPGFVRRSYLRWKTANKANRDAEIERLRFYAGGDMQWRDEEITRRKNQGRAWVTINKCKPPVDQIEGDIRLNPPGPQVFPVGGGADGDTADIMEGLIREVEFRCDARVAYSTAGKYVGASGCAYIEVGTEYENDRSFAQRLVIQSVEDPSTIFFDPDARMANRQDAMWAGKLKMYSREAYIAQFGKDRKVLQSDAVQRARGWIADALANFGVEGGGMAELNSWTGSGKGPYYVCEFCMVEVEPTKLRVYSNGIAYFDDEEELVPRGVTALKGEDNVRAVGRRTIKKYVVDALEVLDETDWLGTIMPWIPVLGPEIYIDGKLHRLSLISGAIDAQRALNYTATTMVELAGFMPKAPWIGPKGSFDDSRWETANTEMWAYLEYTPVMVTDEATGAQQLAQAPQRNLWEAPIQWLIALYGVFSDSIKAVTNVYDPSLGQQKGDQSGKAIEQLRSESNVGNFSYADNLHRAIGEMYRQMVLIFPQILDGPRVVSVVRPDSQHEIKRINQIFGPAGPPKGTKALDITRGEFGVRATVGQSFETARREALNALTEFFKSNPEALKIQRLAASYLRLIGDGNDQVEQMADQIDPQQSSEEQTPEQMQAQLQGLKQQNQQLQTVAQQLHQAIQSKLPQVEADKFKTLIDSLTKIRVAEITASKDLDRSNADREASLLETQLGLAHDAALTATQHAHEASQQAGQQQAAAQAQAADQAHATASQASDQQAAADAQQQQQATEADNEGE